MSFGLFQVLEHVSNLLEFISNMINLLNSGDKINLCISNT